MQGVHECLHMIYMSTRATPG
uniref:Uncharacterized protein n=1 Tax=Anguilla anguilla TaxID=7936 RepID=A0A0E9TZE5_ANGAN